MQATRQTSLDDLGTPLPRTFDLYDGGVGGHHDRRPHGEPVRGKRHGLRVVARRERDDTGRTLVGG